MKVKRGRKKSNRTTPLYPRVQSANAKWFNTMRDKYETDGLANLMDRLLTYARTHLETEFKKKAI